MRLTGINVGEEDEGCFVEREQGIQHQPIDLNGMLDVSGNWVLQGHNVVPILHLVTCNAKKRPIKTYSGVSYCICLLCAYSMRTQPALDYIHVVFSVMGGQQLIIRRAAGQQDPGVVLTHGDEVLLCHARAAGVVMGQFTDGMADGVINRAAHLEDKGSKQWKTCFFYLHGVCSQTPPPHLSALQVKYSDVHQGRSSC